MGVSANVFAIGPFHRDLLPFLTHPPEYYAETREGATLIERVFDPGFSSLTRAISRALGRTEEAYIKNGAFDPWLADIDALRQQPYVSERVDAFLAFRQAGFTFFFFPNC